MTTSVLPTNLSQELDVSTGLITRVIDKEYGPWSNTKFSLFPPLEILIVDRDAVSQTSDGESAASIRIPCTIDGYGRKRHLAQQRDNGQDKKHCVDSWILV